MGRINYSGLVIAGIGFFLTRFTVTLAVYEQPVRFYLAGVLPLTLGLGLAAFGVALAVGDVEASLVRTTALWCVIGTSAMLILVLLTLLGSTAGGMPDLASVRSRTYLSNFLIGGSIGGTLTGLYAARNRRQRSQLHSQANRLEVLNRLLRHEVLNALTAIRGYAALQDDGARDAREVIENRSDAIEATIEEVKYLTRSAGTAETAVRSIDLVECLESAAETVRERHPAATITVEAPPEATVLANARLEQVFAQLIENGVVHSPAEAPTVAVRATGRGSSVRVAVTDGGPGLPASERALLEDGEIEEFDNPRTGFGLNIVRLLVESYNGTIGVDVDDSGTTVSVELPRSTGTDHTLRMGPSSVTGVRPALPHLLVTLVAALVAGVIFTYSAAMFGGSIGIIGVLYGVQSSVVGWIAHEFHSVVFGFVFAGLVTLAPHKYHESVLAHVAIGLAWGLGLWIFAAGVISPVWLRLVGFPASVPSLSLVTFVGHVTWGVSLGLLTALGYRHLTGPLSRWLTRLGRALGVRRR